MAKIDDLAARVSALEEAMSRRVAQVEASGPSVTAARPEQAERARLAAHRIALRDRYEAGEQLTDDECVTLFGSVPSTARYAAGQIADRFERKRAMAAAEAAERAPASGEGVAES